MDSRYEKNQPREFPDAILLPAFLERAGTEQEVRDAVLAINDGIATQGLRARLHLRHR